MKTITSFKITVGDKEYTVNAADVDPSMALNTFLRENLHLTGTKRMCWQGGCGVCLVSVEKEIDGKTRHFSANSCLVPLLSCEGWKIQTNEVIGNSQKGYHKVQKILSENHGTQCGFCSNGMIMNMYSLNKDGPQTMKQIENSFGGNLCRCTGYRPIMTAFKKLASDAPAEDKVEDDLQESTSEEATTSQQTGQCCGNGGCCKGTTSVPKEALESYTIDYATSKWVKIYTLKELLSYISSLGSKTTYRLVASNTGRGVYSYSTSPNVYINILDVAELTAWNLDTKNNKLIIGATKDLNRAMEIFRQVAANGGGWSYLNAVADHLDMIAGFSVRNTGTIAGNLAMKNAHHDFPSDVFLALETFNAKIVVVNTSGKETRVSPNDFVSLDLDKKVIKAIELSKYEPANLYKYATYKIMPRAQNAHAMVNAGFFVKLNSKNVVESANIVYGGINETFVHATYAEAYLKGKNLFTNKTVQGALLELDGEIYPTESPPDASAKYRKELALSLFYKFILKVAPTNLVSSRFLSGGTNLERPVSSAVQEYGINRNLAPIGEAVAKLESLQQVSGKAEYIADMPDAHNQLHAAFVMTRAAAHSTIASIDTSAALKIDGVVAVYTYKDIPGENNFIPSETGLPTPEKLLCETEVEYYNQPIAIVVAETNNKALSAAAQVKVTYNAPTKKAYYTVDDVLAGGADAADRLVAAGAKERQETGSDIAKVIKGTYYMGNQYSFHMENQCCNVIPTDDDGLDIYPSSQWMDLAQVAAAKVLGIQMNKINVHVKRLGGGFGAKISRNTPVSTAAALAAFKLKRPVKMWLPLTTNMRVVGMRIPSKLFYEVGVNSEGIIQYVDGHYYSEYGIGLGNDYISPFFTGLVGHCYKKERWGFDYHYVKTDRATNCYVRAPGSVEGMGSSEAIMDHIAHELNMDPWDVRLANHDGINHGKISEFYETMKTWGEVVNRKAEVQQFNKENRWKKRGLALVPMAWEFLILHRYPCLVSIFAADGTIAIAHGGTEMGQGINTKVAQACAYKFGLTLDKVTVKPSYNVISPNNLPTGGSWTSESVINNMLKACDDLIERMEPVKQTMENPTWLQLVQKCRDLNINLTCTGQKPTDFTSYTIYGMCTAEVEVDILTGQKQITRVDIIEDTGDSLSPAIDMGQVEGAFVMGVGHFTHEEIVFSDVGEVLTDSTWSYKPPGAKDIPLNFRVKFPENNPNPIGVLKSKATAEPPLCLAVSVPLAIRRALHEARQEVDAAEDSWVPFDGPLTVEKTFLGAMNSYEQYTLTDTKADD